MAFWGNFGFFLKLYWRSIFVIIYPLALLPVFLLNDIPPLRCLYVVLLMVGLWVTEALPLPVTSLLPVIFFPLMGIMDSKKTCMCYMKETNMMFIGGIIIAIAIEACNLHKRVALTVIKWIGCSPKRLHVGFVTVTMLVSMWIANTAATAMMIPIIHATLAELETQGVGQVYEEPDPGEPPVIDPDTKEESETRRPTPTTMCYFISIGYASTIGGNGCLLGSGNNLAFKGIYETSFPDSPGISFGSWLAANVPLMILTMAASTVWLQFWYMGLFRPNSNDAQRIKGGANDIARSVIIQKLEEMGALTFHEIAVAACFLTAIVLWLFRKPDFMPGWPELFTDIDVKDSCPAFMVIILMFAIPAQPLFLYAFSSDETKRPTEKSPGLITWKYVQSKMSWGLIFLIGGGFAVAEASQDSGMSAYIIDTLGDLKGSPPIAMMVISVFAGSFITQFASNVAVTNIVAPVVAEMSKVAEVHPLYLMFPVAISCSFAYSLPVSTPPNAIAAAPCNMSTVEMIKVGVPMIFISIICLFALHPIWLPVLWDMKSFPDWAKTPENVTITTVEP